MPRSRVPEPPSRTPLTRERIELAALALIERDGLAEFSTRRLGQELGCEAMSIYHHFRNKAQLLDALVDRVIAEMPHGAPAAPGRMRRADAFARIGEIARGYRGIALRCPKMFQYLALHRMNTRGGIALLAAVLAQFKAAGFDTEQTARWFRAFSYYLTGAALDETAGYAKGPSAVDPMPDAEVARDFPLVAEVGPYFKPGHFEATFELGLNALLDAMRRELRRRR